MRTCSLGWRCDRRVAWSTGSQGGVVLMVLGEACTHEEVARRREAKVGVSLRRIVSWSDLEFG